MEPTPLSDDLIRLRAITDDLAAKYYLTYAAHQTALQHLSHLQEVLRAKQEAVEELLPHYPHPPHPELQHKITLSHLPPSQNSVAA